MTMRRRDFLKGVAAVAGGAALSPADAVTASISRKASQNKLRPNILIITADDMGAETPACFGNQTPDISPNIDTLASQGVRFEHGFVTVAICQPSRSVWVTGRYPHRNGAVGFNPILSHIPTLGTEMKKAGYYTALLGKSSHFQPLGDDRWDLAVETVGRRGRDPQGYGKQMSALLDSAREAGKPFFAMVNLLDPHRPMSKSPAEPKLFKNSLPPDPSRLYGPAEVDVPGYLPDTPEVRQELAYYYNSAKRCDDVVGAVMSALDRSPRRDDTVVMFMSDNGAPLPFGKASCYLQSTRTPWIIRWPGRIKPGSVDDTHFISGIDLMPTVLDIAGAPLPGDLDGRSFLSVLDGDPPGWDRVHVVFHRDQFRTLETRAIHTKQYGYIYNEWRAWMDGETIFVGDNNLSIIEAEGRRNPQYAARVDFYLHRAPEELYDYSKDPHALKNLAGDPAYAAVLSDMQKDMRAWMEKTGDPCFEGFKIHLEAKRKA